MIKTLRGIHNFSVLLVQNIYHKKNPNTLGVLFYLKDNGEMFGLNKTYNSYEEKEDCFNFYARILIADHAVAYSFISEAWFHESYDINDNFPPPDQRSDRRESVIICSQSKKDREKKITIFEIIRTENGAELIAREPPDTFHDRFRFFDRVVAKPAIPITPDVQEFIDNGLNELPWRFRVDKYEVN